MTIFCHCITRKRRIFSKQNTLYYKRVLSW